MSDPERRVRSALADLTAGIERASADLALHEEPAGFVAALEGGAPTGPSPGSSAESPSVSNG
ncbi:MAG: hypothetical protein ACRELS_06425 [Candidatus Rokuibacteriota bacterium]